MKEESQSNEIVRAYRFSHHDLDQSRFHVNEDERTVWFEYCLPLHEWAAKREPFGVDDVRAAGFTFEALVLLLSKGGITMLQESIASVIPVNCIDDEHSAISEAFLKGLLRRTNWKALLKPKSGGHAEPSEGISRVVCDEEAQLSGPSRLVLGPNRTIAEIRFNYGGYSVHEEVVWPEIEVFYIPESDEFSAR